MPPAPQLTIATRVTPEERGELEQRVRFRVGAGATREGARGPRPYALSDALRDGLDLWLKVERREVVVITAGALRDLQNRSAELARLEKIAAAAAGVVESLSPPANADTRDRAHGSRDTTRAAYLAAMPNAGTARAELLEAIYRAGEEGRTADEAIAYVNRIRRNTDRRELAVNGAARRVTDLYQAGAIAPELDADGHERHRKTEHGAQAIVWKVTDKGAKWREELQAND